MQQTDLGAASTDRADLALPRADGADTSAELAELFGRTMRRLHRGTREALAPFGLSGSEARVVRLLADGPMRMTLIAERLSVVPRTVTDIVDGAEAAGVVVRRSDPEDRRSTLVELTPAGRELFDRLEAARHTCAAAVFDALSGDERQQLLGLLRTLCDAPGCGGQPEGGSPEPPRTAARSGGAAERRKGEQS